jgi:hypothetical protein
MVISPLEYFLKRDFYLHVTFVEPWFHAESGSRAYLLVIIVLISSCHWLRYEIIASIDCSGPLALQPGSCLGGSSWWTRSIALLVSYLP